MWLAALFAVGSIGFWSLAVVSTILLLLFVENGRSGWAILTIAATIGLLSVGGLGILPWIVANPALAVGGAFLYFVAGAIWSLAKWFLYVKDRKEKYIEFKNSGSVLRNAKAQFERRLGRDPTESELKAEVVDYIKSNHSRSEYAMPVPSRHKSRIMHWIGYWPWSIINALVFDFCRRICKHIYNALAGVFRKISESVYKDEVAEIGTESTY